MLRKIFHWFDTPPIVRIVRQFEEKPKPKMASKRPGPKTRKTPK